MPPYFLLTIRLGCSPESEIIPVGELKHNVVALARAIKVLGVPIIVTATSPEMWGPVIPELTEALPGTSMPVQRRARCTRPSICLLPVWSGSWREHSPRAAELAPKNSPGVHMPRVINCAFHRVSRQIHRHRVEVFRKSSQNFSPAGVTSPFVARAIPTDSTSVVPVSGR